MRLLHEWHHEVLGSIRVVDVAEDDEPPTPVLEIDHPDVSKELLGLDMVGFLLDVCAEEISNLIEAGGRPAAEEAARIRRELLALLRNGCALSESTIESVCMLKNPPAKGETDMTENERISKLLERTRDDLRGVNWPEAGKESGAVEPPPLFARPGAVLLDLVEGWLRSLSAPLLESEITDEAGELLALVGIDAQAICENSLPDCGPVVARDAEGVPLCLRCYVGLAVEQKNLGYKRYDGKSERVYVEAFEDLPVYGGEWDVEPFALAPLYLDCELGRHFYYEEEARDLGALVPADAPRGSRGRDDELCCPTCRRPYALHGIDCPSLSTASPEVAFQGEPTEAEIDFVLNSQLGEEGAVAVLGDRADYGRPDDRPVAGRQIGEESISDRCERFSARYTREDGSPK